MLQNHKVATHYKSFVEMENRAENKIIVLEGFEATVTKELIYAHFKKAGVKYIGLNQKKNNAYLQFETEKQAKQAIENFFGKALLKRPVIMAFKSDKPGSLSEFHLSGLDSSSADLNAIYKVCAKFGKSCKFRFNLSAGNSKVANSGYLSFLSITPADAENLKKELDAIGIKCDNYDKEKTKKVNVKIENFVEPFKFDKTILVQKITDAEAKLKQALTELCKFNEKDDYRLSITAKPNQNNLNQLLAYVIFDNQEKAIKFFEEIKKAKTTYLAPTAQIAIRVTDESESMANLFSIGIVKPDPKLSDDDLEAQYYKVLKTQFNGILQVALRPMKKKIQDKEKAADAPQVYLAFITLDSEDNGKELLATYMKDLKKKNLKRFYKGDPFFNIFISSNLKKEINKAKEGFKKIERDIKNYGDNLKKQEIQRGGPFSNPRRPYAYPMVNPIPSMNPMNPMPVGGMMRPMMVPQVMPGMSNMPGGIPFPGVNPMASNIPPTLDRAEFLKDKQRHLQSDPTTLKRMLFHILKGDIQQIVLNPTQAIMLTNKVLHDNEPKTLFTLIENKEQLKKKVSLLTTNPTSGTN